MIWLKHHKANIFSWYWGATQPVKCFKVTPEDDETLCFDDIYTVGGDKEAKTREEGRAASFNAPGKRRSHVPGIWRRGF